MSYSKLYKEDNIIKRHKAALTYPASHKTALSIAGALPHLYGGTARPLSREFLPSNEGIIKWYEDSKKNSSAKKFNYRSRKYIIRKNLVNASVEDQFIYLTKSWKNETMMSSITADKIKNLNYQTIIGLGVTFKEKIIYLILMDLEEDVEYWHYALKSITGDNPVPKGMANDLDTVRRYWLAWGKDNKKI